MVQGRVNPPSPEDLRRIHEGHGLRPRSGYNIRRSIAIIVAGFVGLILLVTGLVATLQNPENITPATPQTVSCPADFRGKKGNGFASCIAIDLPGGSGVNWVRLMNTGSSFEIPLFRNAVARGCNGEIYVLSVGGQIINAQCGYVDFRSTDGTGKTIYEGINPLQSNPAPAVPPPADRIQELERFARGHAGVYDQNMWKVHNELRHLYSVKNPPDMKRSLEHADFILQHWPMDDYILHILSDWQMDKDANAARANLLKNARLFPEYRFIGAASTLKVGDLYARNGQSRDAVYFYTLVAQEDSPDMAQYRQIAQQRLSLNP